MPGDKPLAPWRRLGQRSPLRGAVATVLLAMLVSSCGSEAVESVETEPTPTTLSVTSSTAARPSTTSTESSPPAVASRVPDCPGTSLVSAVFELDGAPGDANAQGAVDRFRSAENPDWRLRPDWHDLELLGTEEQSATDISYIFGTSGGSTKLVLELGDFDGVWHVGGYSACRKPQ